MAALGAWVVAIALEPIGSQLLLDYPKAHAAEVIVEEGLEMAGASLFLIVFWCLAARLGRHKPPLPACPERSRRRRGAG